ncbi:peptidylprolyl isomerase [Engelhardtia mirabilis]|uniref:Foldase protein PrsA 3 n=1 Tax=Engelhardtia mirabilis TaxID=2528011 RepID=A0A518BJC1_9BACT|nr:Foldase protein PrsA 3 precursor [Planctomycetes bacterium Pla133]QDV01389.1 Foldase protein PrsA 3 precursor [Planctomycetes bacterium Pla86]
MRRTIFRSLLITSLATVGAALSSCHLAGPGAARAQESTAPPSEGSVQVGPVADEALGSTRPEAVPAPDGIAALIDDEIAITLDEYKTYLLEIYGRRPLEELVYLRLLEREAAALSIEVTEAEVDAAVQAVYDQLLAVRHQGRLEALEAELGEAGYTSESYRRSLRVKEHITLLETREALVLREVTEDMIRERFERDFGVDGVRVEVRHIFLNRARLKADMIRSGADPASLGTAQVEAALASKAASLLEQLRSGADFEALARANSHDLSVQQNGGMIPGYNYRRYGEPMAAAVRAAQVGVPTGPVATTAGLHLIEVTERTATSLDDVREELRSTLADEPASWKERGDLRARLFGEAVIRTY